MPSSLFESPSEENGTLDGFSRSSRAGIDVNKLEKVIYSKYNTIAETVYRIFEVSLGLTYDLYQSFKKDESKTLPYIEKLSKLYFDDGLSSYTKKRLNTKELIDKFEKEQIVNDSTEKDVITGSSNGDFAKFIKLILTDDSQVTDIGLTLDPEKYFTTVSLLRHELNEKFIDVDLIKIDIGNTPNEFPYIKGPRNLWDNPVSAVAFKIIPKLLNIYNSESGELRDSIPDFEYTINIDINKLICSIVTIFDPSDLPEAYKNCENNRDEYVLNGSNIMKNFTTVFTRKIILELYDNICNIRGNWKNFINKCNSEYTRVCSDPSIQNIVGKLSHNNNIVTSIFGPDVVNKEFSEILNSSQYKNYKFDTITDWLSLTSSKFEFGELISDNISGVLLCVFKKAFEVFFSTGVMYKLYLNASNTISNLVLWSYTKEFFAKYDINTLLQNTTSITDYNIRDFFQSIIKNDYYPEMRETYSEKMSNGENVYFMFCKLRRLIWIKILAELKVYLTLIQNGINNENFRNKFSKTWKNINVTLFRLLQQTLHDVDKCEKFSYQQYIYTDIYREIPVENSSRFTIFRIKSLLKCIITGAGYPYVINNSKYKSRFLLDDAYGISSFDNIMLENNGSDDIHRLTNLDKAKWENIINNFIRSGIIPAEIVYDL